jgi:hypothetical protein
MPPKCSACDCPAGTSAVIIANTETGFRATYVQNPVNTCQNYTNGLAKVYYCALVGASTLSKRKTKNICCQNCFASTNDPTLSIATCDYAFGMTSSFGYAQTNASDFCACPSDGTACYTASSDTESIYVFTYCDNGLLLCVEILWDFFLQYFCRNFQMVA